MVQTMLRELWRRTGFLSMFVATVLGAAGWAPAQPADVTFARDVASVLQEKCESCHRPGQMAPMSLTTYEEARPWARAIRSKVMARDMPPWHLDKTTGVQGFVNDISLSDEQIATIVAWVDAGAPLGDRAELPPVREWPDEERWRVGDLLGRDPDLVVESTPWTQPAEGQDQWWQPVVDSGLTEDRWIKAVEVRPTLEGRRIVHHGNSALAEFAVATIDDCIDAVHAAERAFPEWAATAPRARQIRGTAHRLGALYRHGRGHRHDFVHRRQSPMAAEQPSRFFFQRPRRSRKTV